MRLWFDISRRWRPSWRKLSEAEARTLAKLEKRIGVRIGDPALYVQALKHRSFLNISNERHHRSYERLEFLGDAVLSVIVAEALFNQYPTEDEGFLTKSKSNLVNKKTLALRGELMGLGDLVLMSEGEARSGGRTRSSILSDVFEAVLGAVYLDRGYDAARRFVRDHILCESESLVRHEMNANFKGDLLEYTQGRDLGIPHYEVVDETGPEHHKEFTVTVSIQSEAYGMGKGSSKKEAEQKAAQEALSRIASPGRETIS